jgi:hypothetical protein
LDRIDADLLPPRLLVTRAMNRPVMGPAEWDGELVTRLATERPWLHMPKMMRI